MCPAEKDLQTKCKNPHLKPRLGFLLLLDLLAAVRPAVVNSEAPRKNWKFLRKSTQKACFSFCYILLGPRWGACPSSLGMHVSYYVEIWIFLSCWQNVVGAMPTTPTFARRVSLAVWMVFPNKVWIWPTNQTTTRRLWWYYWFNVNKGFACKDSQEECDWFSNFHNASPLKRTTDIANLLHGPHNSPRTLCGLCSSKCSPSWNWLSTHQSACKFSVFIFW